MSTETSGCQIIPVVMAKIEVNIPAGCQTLKYHLLIQITYYIYLLLFLAEYKHVE